ncbi:hypothetical protein [Arthrobacter sp. SX1312]|nr:hypothetical protein [Arthrobacter sp. SX1312]
MITDWTGLAGAVTERVGGFSLGLSRHLGIAATTPKHRRPRVALQG